MGNSSPAYCANCGSLQLRLSSARLRNVAGPLWISFLHWSSDIHSCDAKRSGKFRLADSWRPYVDSNRSTVAIRASPGNDVFRIGSRGIAAGYFSSSRSRFSATSMENLYTLGHDQCNSVAGGAVAAVSTDGNACNPDGRIAAECKPAKSSCRKNRCNSFAYPYFYAA